MTSLKAKTVLIMTNLLEGSIQLVALGTWPQGPRAVEGILEIRGIFGMGTRVEALAKLKNAQGMVNQPSSMLVLELQGTAVLAVAGIGQVSPRDANVPTLLSTALPADLPTTTPVQGSLQS